MCLDIFSALVARTQFPDLWWFPVLPETGDGPRRWGKVVPSPATTSLKYQWDIVQQMRMDPKLGPVITSPRTRSKPKIIAAPF